VEIGQRIAASAKNYCRFFATAARDSAGISPVFSPGSRWVFSQFFPLANILPISTAGQIY
jgi:hypothetical protein